MRLFLNIKPFAFTQNAYVIENNEIIKEETFKLKDINNFIFSHSNLEEVVFIGASKFVTKYVHEAKDFESTKFNHNIIKYIIKEK